MKLFALLPLASLFLGALANPVSAAAALELRAADPVSTLQQFTADSKKYTDAIRKFLFTSLGHFSILVLSVVLAASIYMHELISARCRN